ncbi:MAG: DedA family protein [Mariprofundaceae bacterium]
MEWAQEFIQQYGYWAVFVWTFIEGETVFVVASALAAAGLMEPLKVIVVAAAGAFSGHLFYFALGRWRGMQIIQALPFLRSHYPKTKAILDRYLDHHGNWTIFIFQYLYGTRLVAAILFGCSSMNFWRFFFLQIVNCISWAMIIYAAGHFLGLAAMAMLKQFGVIGLLVALGIIAAIALFAYFRFGHHHFKKQIGQDENRQDKP